MIKPTCPKCSAELPNGRTRVCPSCTFRWRVVGGTLKCEIAKCDWPVVGPRLRALRDTCAQALTLTMRDLYPDVVDALKGSWDGEKFAHAWEATAEKRLREHWNAALVRRREFLVSSPKKLGAGADGGATVEQLEQTHFPVMEYLTAESVDSILSRFTGEHLKDLLASRASFPSWRRGCAFYARSRACDIGGTPNKATLLFPLWGAGRKATELVVAPCGREGETAWRRLVAGVTTGEAGEGRQGLKMGRVGINYDDRKNKWYALVTWTEVREDKVRLGRQAAALNLGCNQFLVAIAEDGATWRVDGTDILAMRRRWNARRSSIRKNFATMGTGSQGRGVKRREQPIRKIDDAEHRWCETKNRQVAHQLMNWCVKHEVSKLFIEDLTGIREAFDRKDPDAEKSDAGLAVKRMIHSWPFYELAQAIERCLVNKADIAVEARACDYNSQRCGACGHTCPENVTSADGRLESKVIDGKVWERRERVTKFACVACGHKVDGDENAAKNHLLDALAKSGGDGQGGDPRPPKRKPTRAKKGPTARPEGEASLSSPR